MNNGYTVIYQPPPAHRHSLPEPTADRRGWIVMCDQCRSVFKCRPGDFWHWTEVSPWTERRWKKKAGIRE